MPVTESTFVDHCEILQLNPKADDSKYEQLLKAQGAWSNPARRQHAGKEETVLNGAQPVDIQAEKQKRHCVLELLYNKMIRTPLTPAMNARELETELGMEKAALDVTVWYMKEREWIRTGDNGRFLITANGMDKFEA